MNFQEYINTLNVQSKSVVKELLKQQSNLNLMYPQDKFNLLIMNANNLLALNGNNDLNFSLQIELLKDVKVKELSILHFDKLIQAATLHDNVLLIFTLFIFKFENGINFSNNSENLIFNEITLLMNLKGNLSDLSLKFLDKFIIPYINVLIYFSEKEMNLFQENLTLLFDNLNYEVEQQQDMVLISDFIFNLLLKNKMISK